MKKLLSISAAALLSLSSASGQTVTLPISKVNVDVYSLLNAHSISEYEALRGDLIEFIWKGAGVPTRLPNVDVDYTANRPLWVTPATTVVRAAHVRDPITPDVYSVLYLLEPPTDNDCLFIYSYGHTGAFIIFGGNTAQGEKDLINARLMAGCDVLLSFMPYNGDNGIVSPTTFPGNWHNHPHDFMASAETATSTPIRYFMDPPIVGITWAISRNGSYSKIGMAGLSGGGWTTVMAAAIDTRITHSYSVAGTMPMHIRAGNAGDLGDWEQSGSDWLGIADYMDLYILGALEPNRRSMQIWNTADSCCFLAGLSYAFTNQLKGIASRMGVTGMEFKISSTTGHTVSPVSIAYIAADF